MTYKEEFITFMVRSGVLTFGDFTTKSGRKTPYFVNTGNYKTGAQAAKLGDYYAACIQEHLPEGITADRRSMRMYVDHQQEYGDNLSFTLTTTEDMQAMNRVIVEADVLGHPEPVLFAVPIIGK